MKEENQKRLNEAQQAVARKDYDEALRLINKTLDDDPDNALGLYMLGFIAIEQERFGLARAVLHRCLELESSQSDVWNAYGRTFQEGHDLKQAEIAYQRAMALNPKSPHPYVNLGLQYVVQGQPKRAMPLLEKALTFGDIPEAKYNLGLAKLLLRDWRGWEDYEQCLGRSKDRKERIYCNPFESRWDGSKDKTIVCYGEQGLGDQIAFASCLPDLIRDSKKVIIETERRLVGLFQRSFPEADVYGTRFMDEVDWLDKYQIDARVAFGSLPKFYRQSTDRFPGTPYLRADDDRRTQWRALFATRGTKPKVGICWTGGTKATGRDRRSLKLEQFLPILKQDVTFVSLEYSEEAEKQITEFEKKHGIKIHHWDRATVSHKYHDYDETAALIAELDMVIGVTTSALHLAGALGVKTWALVPEWPTWLWGVQGDTLPWNKSLKLYRQRGTWDSLIARVAHDFKNLHWDGSETTSSLQRPSAVDTPVREALGLCSQATDIRPAPKYLPETGINRLQLLQIPRPVSL